MLHEQLRPPFLCMITSFLWRAQKAGYPAEKWWSQLLGEHHRWQKRGYPAEVWTLAGMMNVAVSNEQFIKKLVVLQNTKWLLLRFCHLRPSTSNGDLHLFWRPASVIRRNNVHHASGTKVTSSILANQPACQNTLCTAWLSNISEGTHCTSNACNPDRSCKCTGSLCSTTQCLTSTPQRTTATNHLAVIVLMCICFSWTLASFRLGSLRQAVDNNSSRSNCKRECKLRWLHCAAMSSHKQSNLIIAEGFVVRVPLLCCFPCFDVPRWRILACWCAFVRLKLACPICLCVLAHSCRCEQQTKSHEA